MSYGDDRGEYPEESEGEESGESESGSEEEESGDSGDSEEGSGTGEEDENEEEEDEPVLKYKRFAKEVVASISDPTLPDLAAHICSIAVHSKVMWDQWAPIRK